MRRVEKREENGGADSYRTDNKRRQRTYRVRKNVLTHLIIRGSDESLIIIAWSANAEMYR